MTSTSRTMKVVELYGVDFLKVNRLFILQGNLNFAKELAPELKTLILLGHDWMM